MRIIFAVVTVVSVIGSGCASESLHVKVSDCEGNPVSNAIVSVGVSEPTHFWGSNRRTRKSAKYEARTDSNGVATVRFNCVNFMFGWSVEAEGFYRSEVHTETFKDFDEVYIPPAPPKIILHEHEKTGTAVLYRKKNPQPMCVHYRNNFKTPTTNGRFGFDMVKCDWVSPHGKGSEADFYLVRNVRTVPESGKFVIGRIEFDKGCGYYVSKQTGNPNFASTYVAEDSNVFKTNIVLYGIRYGGQQPLTIPHPVIGDDEFLVMRTRAKFDNNGHLVSANYSKILAPFFLYPNVHAAEMVLNPTPLDRNLEWDMKNNLCPKPGKIGQPQP